MIFQNQIGKQKKRSFQKKSQIFLEVQVWQQFSEIFVSSWPSDGDPFAELLHGSLKVISPDKSSESVAILFHFL